ncbi:hypothetical protein AAVH_13923 [Aphelenchoides avenae]|nr:hypothetical protein AAVH_13923 [Aphelenchus avenae]
MSVSLPTQKDPFYVYCNRKSIAHLPALSNIAFCSKSGTPTPSTFGYAEGADPDDDDDPSESNFLASGDASSEAREALSWYYDSESDDGAEGARTAGGDPLGQVLRALGRRQGAMSLEKLIG